MKRFFLAIFLTLLLPASSYAARNSIATDDFNRGSIGANWESTEQWDCSAVIIDLSTRFTGSHSSAPCSSRWVGTGTFTNDHYSKAAVVSWGGSTNQQVGVACRMSADINSSGTNARDHYQYTILDDSGTSSKTTRLIKYINGAPTTLDTATVAWTGGDTIEIECEGTTIRGFKNGVQQVSVTDASLSTGGPGIIADGGIYGDNWEGGSITAGGGGGLKPRQRIIIQGKR